MSTGEDVTTTKPAEVTREHRELAARLLFPGGYAECSGVAKWVHGSLSAFERGMEPRMVTVAEALADAEARGEQRGREAAVARIRKLEREIGIPGDMVSNGMRDTLRALADEIERGSLT
jgi:hypothetical protein